MGIDAIPKTVGTFVVDDSITIRMDLKGLVDFDVEIKRLTKSLNLTVPSISNLEKKMNAPGYQEKVKEELKKANEEKLNALKKKKSDIEEAIENFKQLAIAAAEEVAAGEN